MDNLLLEHLDYFYFISINFHVKKKFKIIKKDQHRKNIFIRNIPMKNIFFMENTHVLKDKNTYSHEKYTLVKKLFL